MAETFNSSEISSMILAQEQATQIRAMIDDETKVTEDGLRVDPVWSGSARALYAANNDRPFEGSEEEAAQYGLNEMSSFYTTFFNAELPWSQDDSKGLVEYLRSFEEWTDDQKLTFAYLSEMYEAKGVSVNGIGRGLKAMAQDWTNLASFGGPMALFGKWTGRQAAKEGFRAFVRHHARSILTKRGLIASGVAAADGATVMHYDDDLRQRIEAMQADVKIENEELYPDTEEYEYGKWRHAIAMTSGATFALALLGIIKGTQVGVRGVQDALSDIDVKDAGFDLTGSPVVREDPVPQPTKFDPKDLHSRMPTDPVHTRRGTRGFTYDGAPKKKGSHQFRQGLIRRLFPRIDDNLAMKDRSFGWYEDAGQSIEHITRGDQNLKERMVRYLAIYSRNTDVEHNTAAAIEAAFQAAKGNIPHTGQTPNVTAAEMENLMSIPEFDTRHNLIGNKVMNFYRNLHDPAFGRNDFDDAVTIDRHMYKLMGYEGGKNWSPTNAQYAYAVDVVQEITRKYNEEHGTNLLPRQIQAALWTQQRNVSETDAGRGISFSGFKEEIARATSHVTWEANSPIFPGFSDLSLDQQVQFTREARELLIDDAGNDIILSKILEHPLYKHMAAAGSWEGVISPNTQSAIVLPRVEGKTGGAFDSSIAELYASLMGHIYHQDAVPWFRFDSRLDTSLPNINQGYAVRVSGHDATQELTEELYEAMGDVVPGVEFTRINLENGDVAFSFINFRDESGKPYGLSDQQFLSKMQAGVNKFFSNRKEITTSFDIANEGRLLQGDAEYTSKINSRGSSDLLDWSSSRRTAFEELVNSWQSQGPTANPAAVPATGGTTPEVITGVALAPGEAPQLEVSPAPTTEGRYGHDAPSVPTGSVIEQGLGRLSYLKGNHANKRLLDWMTIPDKDRFFEFRDFDFVNKIASGTTVRPSGRHGPHPRTVTAAELRRTSGMWEARGSLPGSPLQSPEGEQVFKKGPPITSYAPDDPMMQTVMAREYMMGIGIHADPSTVLHEIAHEDINQLVGGRYLPEKGKYSLQELRTEHGGITTEHALIDWIAQRTNWVSNTNPGKQQHIAERIQQYKDATGYSDAEFNARMELWSVKLNQARKRQLDQTPIKQQPESELEFDLERQGISDTQAHTPAPAPASVGNTSQEFLDNWEKFYWAGGKKGPDFLNNAWIHLNAYEAGKTIPRPEAIKAINTVVEIFGTDFGKGGKAHGKRYGKENLRRDLERVGWLESGYLPKNIVSKINNDSGYWQVKPSTAKDSLENAAVHFGKSFDKVFAPLGWSYAELSKMSEDELKNEMRNPDDQRLAAAFAAVKILRTFDQGGNP